MSEASGDDAAAIEAEGRDLPTMAALDALESDLDGIDAELQRLDRDP
jgi:hypothetical protein